MPYESNKYSAVIIGITIVILLWMAHVYSFFDFSNGYSYDLLMRNNLSADASRKVIIVELDHDPIEQGDKVWLNLLKQLLKHDIEQIAIPYLPEKVTEQFYQYAAASEKVVFGVPIVSSAGNITDETPILPDAATNQNITYGYLPALPNQHGVFREQFSTVKIGNSIKSGFELQVAKQILPADTELPDGRFKVNFIGNQERIPIINGNRVLAGGLINELVSGRTILISIKETPVIRQYYTPVSSGLQLTSQAMFHAFALDTLISQREIKSLPSWALIVLILSITGITLFICQWLTFRMSMTISFLATCLYIFLCWAALHFIFIWIPLTELLLSQWMSFALVWRYRVDLEDHNLNQLLFGLSLKLREKVNPVSFYHTDEPWQQLIELLNQSLEMNRLIFLERVKGDHRLKEIKAHNCSIDDITEMRRDYERTPYSTAISENRPVILERPYLRELDVEEKQFLAPLIFAGEILGFWAFSIKVENLEQDISKFNAITLAFMTQISEIIHYRQEWQRQRLKNENKFSSYLRVEGGSDHVQQLNTSITLLDKRGMELQEVFNNINTHCILYDLFGRVLLVNNKMEAFALDTGLLLFNVTMLDFIVELTGYDRSRVRFLVQQIIFDHEPVFLPFVHPILNQSYMLNLSPMRYLEDKNQDQFIPDENHVFQISGVLCELVDMSDLRNLYQLKEKMYQHFSFQMRKNLSSISLSLPALEELKNSETDRLFEINKIKKKVEKSINMLDSTNEQMHVEIEHMLSNNLICYPVCGKIALETAITGLQEIVEQRGITVDIQLPEHVSLVFASPQELETIFHTVLSTLIADTYENGDIWVSVEETDKQVLFKLRNTGIGIADAKQQQYLESGSTKDTDLIKFYRAIQLVKTWEGDLNITSQLGESSNSTLTLKRFL